ncbi:LpqB family beta-propeller domain-containing protein [Actinokineospora sp.]|uniref:LpqB family beta-propeller domain-containing protein n=1 Tax=Actinokineospora sp. TaxID=1872133 RepID=UPI004038461F
MTRTSATTTVLALLSAVVLAGCANIPDQTLPKVVLDAPAEQPRPIRKPTPDLDLYPLVQEFIDRSGRPEAAATYLTEAAKQDWPRDRQLTIVEDGVKTRPLSVQEPSTNGGVNEQAVVLSAKQVGRLATDRSFFPSVQQVDLRINVQRQPDLQWRISAPPDGLLITESVFKASYRRVNLQFFDPEQRVMVSDPRYVEIEPQEGLEGRVVNLLLAGPSDQLKGAVRTQFEGVGLRTNVVQEADGAILINLTQVTKSAEDKQRMVAQIVNSLREVTSSPLRLLTEGRSLIPGQEDWRPSDVGSYDASLKPDLLGLVVVDGKLRSMRDGKPVEGPAGAGAYDIASAAQSLDGGQLAVVERGPAGMRLRVGRTNGELPEVALSPSATLTRPTWLPGDGDENGSNEVWTVQDGTVVVRAVRTADGSWRSFPVDASELTRDGGTITQLRLSRDGVRVAAVVNGEVKVAAVVRTNDAVVIRPPSTLQDGLFKGVIGLDWLDRVTLIVATEQSALPVASVPIDGLTYTPYNSSILTLPVTAITAAPSRSAVVTDGSGMWSTQEAGKVWQVHQHGQGPRSLPFYPG